jgi:hypothetical protein
MDLTRGWLAYILISTFLGCWFAYDFRCWQYESMDRICRERGLHGASRGKPVNGDLPHWRRYMYLLDEPYGCRDIYWMKTDRT